MAGDRAVPRIPIQLSRGVLVASVQVDLDDAVLAGLRDDLLARVQASGATGVIVASTGEAPGINQLDLVGAWDGELAIELQHRVQLHPGTRPSLCVVVELLAEYSA